MRGGIVRSPNHARSTCTTHNDHRLAPSELLRPLASGLQRLQRGADRRLKGRRAAGGHDRRLGRHGGHAWAADEVSTGCGAACSCADGGIRAHLPSSAEAPKGYGSVVRRPEVRVAAYPRPWPASGAWAGCSPSQDGLRGRAYMPPTSVLDASTGDVASRRETGVSRGMLVACMSCG